MASNKTKRKAQPAAAATSQRDAAKAPVKAKSSAKSAPAAKKAKDSKDAKKGGKPGIFARAAAYFKNVRTEMKRVVWPTRDELVKYSVAVVAMLVFFGVLIAVVDSLILPALYAFSGLR